MNGALEMFNKLEVPLNVYFMIDQHISENF